jgi:hypothetical protein
MGIWSSHHTILTMHENQFIIISINNIIYNGECGMKFLNGCMYIKVKKQVEWE